MFYKSIHSARLSHLAAAFACAAMIGFAPAMASAAEAQPRPIISVDGTAEAEATPDTATITLGVMTHDSDAAKAQTENARLSSAVNQAVRSLGIDAKDISTTNYYFSPTYRTDDKHQQEISGYTVKNTVVVKMHDLKLTGRVIDLALKSGANEVHSLQFSTSDTSAVRRDALRRAAADARAKADILASALGHRVIGISSVSESSSINMPRSYGSAMLMAKAANDAATTIEPGTLTMSANVHVDFIIDD